VSFAGGAESTLALLGVHVYVISTGLGNMAEQVQAGRMRTLIVTGPKRMWGPFANVPTWKEVGVDYVATTWRGFMGAKGMTPAQVAYWDGVFRKVVQTAEWKEELKENYWANVYTGPAETRKRLDHEYADLKETLTALGMVKGR
jgi:putative tricarboxylic transport membrane protein